MNEQISGLTQQRDAKREEIKLNAKELDGIRSLWAQKLVSIEHMTALEREAVRLEGEFGHGELDDVAALMLAQVISVEGAECEAAGHRDLIPARIRSLPLEGRNSIVIGFLNPDSLKYSRFAVRRLRRLAPHARVGLVLWTSPGSERPFDEKQLAEQLEADFVAFSLVDCVVGALSDEKPRHVKPKRQRSIRRSRAATSVPIKAAAVTEA